MIIKDIDGFEHQCSNCNYPHFGQLKDDFGGWFFPKDYNYRTHTITVLPHIERNDTITTTFPYIEQNDTLNKEEEPDMVNHPPHYEREGAMECIDEMALIFGQNATMNFCLLNAWKYRYRAADKNGEEDIKKSDWYIAKYKELKEGKN